MPWTAAPEGSLEEGAWVRLRRREQTLTSRACFWLSLPDAASGETLLLGETEAQEPQQLLVEPGSGALPGTGKPGVRQGFLGEGVKTGRS